MARWSAINAEDIHLATVRVYTPEAPNKKPRIVLFLPPNNDPAKGPEPDYYELDMVNDNVENQIVVAERPKDPALSVSTSSAAATVNTRARTTILTGRIKHECNLRPTFTQTYRHQMRERHKKYNTPMRQIRMIDDAGVPGGRGGVNRLSSGVGVGAGGAFGDLIVSFSFQFPPPFPSSSFCFIFFVLFFYFAGIKKKQIIESETETSQRHFRTYGSYATQSTPRPTVCFVS